MMSLFHSGKETRIHRISRGNKLDGVWLAIWQPNPFKPKNVLIDGDPENILLSMLMHLQIVRYL